MSSTLREASKDTLQAKDKTYHYYSLPLAAKSLGDITRLPKSLKVLLENLLRWQDGKSVTKEDIHALPLLIWRQCAKRLNASAAILQRLTHSHRSTWSLTTR